MENNNSAPVDDADFALMSNLFDLPNPTTTMDSHTVTPPFQTFPLPEDMTYGHGFASMASATAAPTDNLDFALPANPSADQYQNPYDASSTNDGHLYPVDTDLPQSQFRYGQPLTLDDTEPMTLPVRQDLVLQSQREPVATGNSIHSSKIPRLDRRDRPMASFSTEEGQVLNTTNNTFAFGANTLNTQGMEVGHNTSHRYPTLAPYISQVFPTPSTSLAASASHTQQEPLNVQPPHAVYTGPYNNMEQAVFHGAAPGSFPVFQSSVDYWRQTNANTVPPQLPDYFWPNYCNPYGPQEYFPTGDGNPRSVPSYRFPSIEANYFYNVGIRNATQSSDKVTNNGLRSVPRSTSSIAPGNIERAMSSSAGGSTNSKPLCTYCKGSGELRTEDDEGNGSTVVCLICKGAKTERSRVKHATITVPRKASQAPARKALKAPTHRGMAKASIGGELHSAIPDHELGLDDMKTAAQHCKLNVPKKRNSAAITEDPEYEGPRKRKPTRRSRAPIYEEESLPPTEDEECDSPISHNTRRRVPDDSAA